MQLLSTISKINDLPPSGIKDHIKATYLSLVETDDDIPPIFIIVEEDDDITGPDYAFIGSQGLLSDLWDRHKPRHPKFSRPYEWSTYIEGLTTYLVQYLVCNEDCYFLYISASLSEKYPVLKWVLTASELGGLSDPQPL